MSRLLIILFAALVSSAVSAAEPVEIPLKEVWAYKMPDTKDFKNTDAPQAEKSVVQKVLKQVRDNWRKEHGYVVEGDGMAALRQFYRARCDKLPNDEAPADAPVSLIFFTNSTGWYVHIESIEREDDKFVITYRFVPHETAETTQHLAVIPLGKLLPGNYAVTIVRMPMDKKYRQLGFPEPPPKQSDVVCKSFKFNVVRRR
jgi:hypothetical protein